TALLRLHPELATGRNEVDYEILPGHPRHATWLDPELPATFGMMEQVLAGLAGVGPGRAQPGRRHPVLAHRLRAPAGRAAAGPGAGGGGTRAGEPRYRGGDGGVGAGHRLAAALLLPRRPVRRAIRRPGPGGPPGPPR